MSILHYDLRRNLNSPEWKNPEIALETIDERWDRNSLEDLKYGMELIFEFKNQLEKMHPIAAETIIKMLSN